MVVAPIRESENKPLLLRSGADAAVTSSEAAGRLLGWPCTPRWSAKYSPTYWVHGDGLELVERDIQATEVGRSQPIAKTP